MPYEWTYDPPSDFGDETEYEIIVAKGQEEAENFGGRGALGKPAKWLNPPRPLPDRWHDFVIYHPEDFIKMKEDDGSS